MFEKDAINEKACEHCNEVMCSVCEHKTCDNTHLGTLKCREWRDRRAGFYCGAEFGYNKANEWHKADVPTTPINKVVLGYIKDYNTKKFCLVKWNGEWWYDARTWNDKVKLIAWKEIVLPELPKEIE